MNAEQKKKTNEPDVPIVEILGLLQYLAKFSLKGGKCSTRVAHKIL